jgi:hypothetical protein
MGTKLSDIPVSFDAKATCPSDTFTVDVAVSLDPDLMKEAQEYAECHTDGNLSRWIRLLILEKCRPEQFQIEMNA